ncbi:MAG: outer membrane beta-barrel protein [Roseibium sp.]|nr:outer membrane beta-barrel protein [Roseibium sp.]
MPRAPVWIFIVFAVTGPAALAQEGTFDLRGAVGADELLDDPFSDPAEDPDLDQILDDDPNPVVGLPPFSNDAAAEEGSTGLGTAGRVVAVRPFSDRIAAVSSVDGVRGAGLDDSVFGGDTTFDAAEGLRFGRFTIFPEITVTGGWTDNTSQSASGEAGSLYRIVPNITASSDWSRHQLNFALRGSYVGYPDSSEDSDPNITASAGYLFDLSASTTLDAEISYSYTRESASSAESASGRDDIHEIEAEVGARRDVGLLGLRASAGIDRNIYTADDAVFSSNSSSRDNTLYSAGLRLDSNDGGMLSPFVEGSLLARRFDRECSDSLCEKRDSTGYEIRGGLVIGAGPKLTGELGAGWRIEDLEDERLDNLAGLVVEGSLVWSPSRMTTVTAGLGTSFETTDIDGASGSIIYSGDVRLAHGFNNRLVGEVGAGYSYRTYQGVSIDEQTLTGLFGLTYALTQNVALRTGYTYRHFTSSNSGSDYTQNSVEAGLRFRH